MSARNLLFRRCIICRNSTNPQTSSYALSNARRRSCSKVPNSRSFASTTVMSSQGNDGSCGSFPVQYKTEELRKKLSPEQYHVTQEGGTERAFSGKYWNNKDKGMYNCVVCDVELFSSDTKFDSGSGWPSFSDVVNKGNVKINVDKSHGMVRKEVVCAKCGGHLGHVFDDGPTQTKQRYCINSASVDFKK